MKFKGNYTKNDDQKVTFIISQAVLGTDIIARDMAVMEKKNSAKQTPVPKLFWKETGREVSAKYFRVEYDRDVTEGGTYQAELSPQDGQNNFTGTAEALITVVSDKKLMLENAKISFDPKTGTYTGSPVEPAVTVTVKDGSKDVTVPAECYKKTWTNNINPGTATLMIEAVSGNSAHYAGSKTVSYKITGKRSLKEQAIAITCVESVPYAKGGAKSAVTVYDGKTLLKEGVDYTLSWSKNKKVTTDKTAEVKIKGKGNYKDSVTLKYAVSKQNLSGLARAGGITAEDQFAAKSKVKTPKVTVTDLDGKKLTKNTDYKVEKTDTEAPGNTEDAGVITVTITGLGAYEGEETVSCRYVSSASANIAKAKAKKIADQEYTGGPVTLSANDLKDILFTGKSSSPSYLNYGTDFTVTPADYQKNVKKGTAKVTVKGCGAFAGKKTLSFKIIQKKTVFRGVLTESGWQNTQ